jgi:hypothetical protein
VVKGGATFSTKEPNPIEKFLDRPVTVEAA